MATGRVPTTANSPLTAKGDLFGYSTTQARVAVGNDGETLVADSSASTGLRWQGNFAAGKNKVINGDFNIWQRGSSFTLSASTRTYTADRFNCVYVGSSQVTTVSRQAFSAGTAPVSGYESEFFLRYAVTGTVSGNIANQVRQPIEDVRTFAGQTATFSFWAKADTNRSLTVYFSQNFGSGGSSEVFTSVQTVNITSSWARYSVTVALPSISGKTIGAGNCLTINVDPPPATVQTIDLWGWQLEAGSVATAFQTATGTLAGELAACQRYYYAANGGIITAGIAPNTVYMYGRLVHPVPMRTTPSGSISASGTSWTITDDYSAAFTSTAVTGFGNDSWITSTAARVSLSGFTGLTGGRFYSVDGRGAGQIFFSAEL